MEPTVDPNLPVNARECLAHARSLWIRGHQAQLKGDLDGGISLYRRSLELKPTAEAYTFLGWALSFRGDLNGAVAECLKAIETDPGFGNPYNDIGAYFIQLGRYEEAIPWLKKAQRARRYEPRHYPHYNLGFAYLHLGQSQDALREFEKALAKCPTYEPAARMVEYLKQNLA